MGRLSGPLDPTADAGWTDEHPRRVGFFTDTSICIGCKACEVACKEWNHVPEDGLNWTGQSYDNTGALGASTWRHVAFVEQPRPLGDQVSGVTRADLGMPAVRSAAEVRAASRDGSGQARADAGGAGTAGPGAQVLDGGGLLDLAGGSRGPSAGLAEVPDTHPGSGGVLDMALAGHVSAGEVSAGHVPAGQVSAGVAERPDFRWLMSSDVCKHCTHAACLDVCPTGALFRTEFGTVVVQGDVCNGCGYCVPACPYGVIERREGPKGDAAVGTAQKCTLCYDRLAVDETPACAKACPTQSIQFGPLDELRERAAARVDQLHDAGVPDARLYGESPGDGVGGAGAFFLLLDDPEVYGLPPDPQVCTAELPAMYRSMGLAALGLLAGVVAAFAGRRR